MIARWLLCLILCLPSSASGACRLALSLGLDISGSVNAREYRLQLDGLAAALRAPDVQQALMAMPGAWVEISIFEWSGPVGQRILQPWIELSDTRVVEDLAHRLNATVRVPGEASTALGAALLFGGDLLVGREECWRRVLDLSGDGKSNTGPRPQAVRDGAAPEDMIVNALVIGSGADGRRSDLRDLVDYFRANVLRGPEAFVEIAEVYDDYARAMERKLLRELQVQAIGRADPVR